MVETLLEAFKRSKPQQIAETAANALSDLQGSRLSFDSLPAHLQLHLRWEQAVYWRCYDQMHSWLSRIEQTSTSDREKLDELASPLEVLADRLQLATALLCQARDAELGPTTHPSPNRLLACRDSAEYAAQLNQECALIETELQAAVLAEQKVLLGQLLAMLRAGQTQLQSGSTDWGTAWLRVDLATFQRRNQWKPFPWPVLNLALNSLWAFEQDQVEECLTHYFCDLAQQELSRMPGTENLAKAIESPDTTSALMHQLLVQLQSRAEASNQAKCSVCQLPWSAGQLLCPGCGARN